MPRSINVDVTDRHNEEHFISSESVNKGRSQSKPMPRSTIQTDIPNVTKTQRLLKIAEHCIQKAENGDINARSILKEATA
jgi:hypothetical protein